MHVAEKPSVKIGFDQFRAVSGAEILLIGDSPTKEDIKQGECFSSGGAKLIAAELAKLGINYAQCNKAVCVDYWPSGGDAMNCIVEKVTLAKKMGAIKYGEAYIPERTREGFEALRLFIAETRPKLIISFGSLSLYALTGHISISAWRGSQLIFEQDGFKCNYLPTFNPTAISKKHSWGVHFRRDLQRAFSQSDFTEPEFDFLLGGNFAQYKQKLEQLCQSLDDALQAGHTVKVSVDIETRRSRYITVCGLATSARSAFVIPFTSMERANYFTVEEECEIAILLKRVLEHKAIDIIGQNFQYDFQYFAANYGIKPTFKYDTMIMAHAIWTKSLELGLSFLASMYCSWYRYWKDDGKQAHEGNFKEKSQELAYWRYNGYDCCYTYEVAEGLIAHWEENETDTRKELMAFQRKMQNKVLKPVLKGLRFDKAAQNKAKAELQTLAAQYEAWFEYMIPNSLCEKNGESPWWNSPQKLSHLLFEQWGLPPVRDKKTGSYTTGGDAPKQIGKAEPLLALVMKKLDEYRSIQQFLKLYCNWIPSPDGNIRTQYMLGGTDTFRLASKIDAFGEGANLQNVTKG